MEKRLLKIYAVQVVVKPTGYRSKRFKGIVEAASSEQAGLIARTKIYESLHRSFDFFKLTDIKADKVELYDSFSFVSNR